jgi:hypothetical protein
VRSLPQILALYEEIDTGFEQEQLTAGADAARISKIEENRRLNDQAYFVLCWGQLEAEINEVCREAIRRRRDSPQWNARRGWDLIQS